jgi:hypothetical protein
MTSDSIKLFSLGGLPLKAFIQRYHAGILSKSIEDFNPLTG